MRNIIHTKYQIRNTITKDKSLNVRTIDILAERDII